VGIIDVNDCVNGARYLADRGEVDGNRLAIRGGSAGGYTTLCALTFRNIFKAGASHYGICDLEALARDTHKFESRYLDRLIGPYPEHRDLYVARSPIHFTDRLNCLMIIFQAWGQVFAQPSRMVPPCATVRRRTRLPRAETSRACSQRSCFYSKIFGFELADPLEPVEIENL
jgi:hypothetical protein